MTDEQPVIRQPDDVAGIEHDMLMAGEAFVEVDRTTASSPCTQYDRGGVSAFEQLGTIDSIEQHADGTLVARGSWCAPPDPIYDLWAKPWQLPDGWSGWHKIRPEVWLFPRWTSWERRLRWARAYLRAAAVDLRRAGAALRSDPSMLDRDVDYSCDSVDD